MKREELKRYTSSEIEEIDDALLEASEDGTIKMTRVYIASEADSVMESYEKRIKELEAEREISNSYDDAWKMAERIHELENALESRLKVIEDSRVQIETLTKELSESAIGHDWLSEKELIEADNAAMKKRIKDLEHVPQWHQCEHPDSEGFYDLPPESGEYIVQVRSRSGHLETFAAEFDADYSDWPELINGSVVIQWCEEPKPSIKTQTEKSKERKDNFFFKNKTLTKTNK